MHDPCLCRARAPLARLPLACHLGAMPPLRRREPRELEDEPELEDVPRSPPAEPEPIDNEREDELELEPSLPAWLIGNRR